MACSRRSSLASMMVGVALVVVGFAALPYLRTSPVPTLTAAALVASILAVADRGREKRLVRGVLLLSLAAGLTFGVGECVSLWRLSARDDRLARHHAGALAATNAAVTRLDELPDRFRDAKVGNRERSLLVQFLE